MRTVRNFLLVLLVAPALVLAGDLSLADLQKDNALLLAEYDLARAGKPYLLIDLQERQLQLKASGLPLENWNIVSSRFWGHPSAIPAVNLQSKSALAEPERDVYVVNETVPDGQAAAKAFKAFELADMPTSYRLHLGNGTDISVSPAPGSWLEHLRRMLTVPYWYLSRPLISSWNFLLGSPYNELALAIPAQDARRLYWAFSEGTPCLIRLPAAVAAATVPSTAGSRR